MKRSVDFAHFAVGVFDRIVNHLVFTKATIATAQKNGTVLTVSNRLLNLRGNEYLQRFLKTLTLNR